MTSAAGVWLSTYDEAGQHCWVNNVTRQRTYDFSNGQPNNPTPVSPVLAPRVPYQQVAAPYGVPGAGAAYSTQYPYEGQALGAVPPFSLSATPGYGRTYYPSGSVNWM